MLFRSHAGILNKREKKSHLKDLKDNNFENIDLVVVNFYPFENTLKKTKSDQDWLKRKLKVAEIGENFDVSKMKKIVAGKKLWNYDNLEPTEKKGAI